MSQQNTQPAPEQPASPLQAPQPTGLISPTEFPTEPFSRPANPNSPIVKMDSDRDTFDRGTGARRSAYSSQRYDLGSAPTEDGALRFSPMGEETTRDITGLTNRSTYQDSSALEVGKTTETLPMSPLPMMLNTSTGSQKRPASSTLSSNSGDYRQSELRIPDDDFKSGGESIDGASVSPFGTPEPTIFVKSFPPVSVPRLGDRGSSEHRLGATTSANIPVLPSNFDPKVFDFDYDCFRSDDGKSDEEFLDPKFWKELQVTRKKNKTRLTKRKTRTGLSLNTSSSPNYRDVATEAEEGVKQMVLDRREHLIELSGWLEKQSPSLHARWQKRWVVVVEHTLFYWKEKVAVGSKAEAEKTDHLNKISLFLVDKIVKDDNDKKGRKFEIVARDPRSGERRNYRWRCENQKLCGTWVEGLQAHKEQAMSELKMGVMAS